MDPIKIVIVFYCVALTRSSNECDQSSGVCRAKKVPSRYILYDVNPQEGFNLRRDIYMRLARFVKQSESIEEKYHLILPPWDNLPHWGSKLAGSQRNLPWSLFFNMKILQDYAPVIEAYEFFESYPNIILDHVFVLQNYRDLWSENFIWTEKWSIEPCAQLLPYEQNEQNTYSIRYGSFDISARNVDCVSFQGSTSLLADLLSSYDGKTILLSHAEILLHDYFGDAEYWRCRKSMQFSDELVKIATDFMTSALPLSDERNHPTRESSYYAGKPYLCVHFRRRDYKYSRKDHIPSIKHASSQIREKLSLLNLSTVFFATDTDDAEFQKLRDALHPFTTVRFIPPSNVLRTYKDGGVAIIEQIVCSYARYFIGSYESTYSFRIEEERELLNFDPDTTFNRLCGDEEQNCEQPTRWLKVL